MFMKNDGDKKLSEITEQIIDIVCLAASFGILFLLPHKIDFFFYLIFGISAFLFCVGFFRLGFTIKVPAVSGWTLFTGIFFALSGVIINIVGLYEIWRDHGSGRSITIATLLLIEALLFFAIAGSSAKTLGAKRMAAILLRIVAVLAGLFGIAFAIWKGLREFSVLIGTMLLIEAICLWKMGSGSNPFNTLTPEIQAVPGMQIPIEELRQIFAGVDTQLRYPWIGKIETIKEESIIYGPSEDGFCVYCYYQFGRFYVSGSTSPFFPDPEDAQGHIVREIPDENGILLAKENLPEAYAAMFIRYVESGEAQWRTI